MYVLHGYDRVFIASGIVGALGSLVIIITYLWLPSMRTKSRQLLVYLSIADLLQALFFCLYPGELMKHPTVCFIHHLLGIYGSLSSFFWTVCIAFYVWMTLRDPFKSDSYIWILHVISWGLPLLVISPYLLGIVEPEYEWPIENGLHGWFPCCRKGMSLWIEYNIPLMVSWVLTVLFYNLALWQIRSLELHPASPGNITTVKFIFFIIPLVFIVTRVFGLVEILLTGEPVFLMYARAMMDPSQGFWNAIVFIVLTPSVRTRLWLSVTGYSGRYENIAIQEVGPSDM